MCRIKFNRLVKKMTRQGASITEAEVQQGLMTTWTLGSLVATWTRGPESVTIDGVSVTINEALEKVEMTTKSVEGHTISPRKSYTNE